MRRHFVVLAILAAIADRGEDQRALDEHTQLEAVRADVAEAQRLGIRGVPFFVLDDRYGISGAQPTELFAQALQQAWSERQPIEVLSAGGPGCEGDNCAV